MFYSDSFKLITFLRDFVTRFSTSTFSRQKTSPHPNSCPKAVTKFAGI